MVKLIDRYGINIVKKGKIRYYSPKFKREMFDYYGSIISVVGKTTVEIIELFECTQKVP